MTTTATMPHATNGYHAPEPARTPGPLERLRLAEADLVRRLDAIADAVHGVGTHLIERAEAKLAERLAALEARLEAAALRSAALIDATAGRLASFGAAADADRDAAARVSLSADPVPVECREAQAADPRNAGDYCPFELPGSHPAPRPEVLAALATQDAADDWHGEEPEVETEQPADDAPPAATAEDDTDYLRRFEEQAWPADAEAEDAAAKRMDAAEAAGVPAVVPGPTRKGKKKSKR